jgi:hypothetical protein
MITIARTASIAGKMLLTAGLLGAVAMSIAYAGPLGPQADLQAENDLVTHVKKKVKGGKGGKHHHHGHNHHIDVGVIVLGTGIAYCAGTSASCEENYGEGTNGYWRCMRRAGCDW